MYRMAVLAGGSERDVSVQLSFSISSGLITWKWNVAFVLSVLRTFHFNYLDKNQTQNVSYLKVYNVYGFGRSLVACGKINNIFYQVFNEAQTDRQTDTHTHTHTHTHRHTHTHTKLEKEGDLEFFSLINCIKMLAGENSRWMKDKKAKLEC